MTGFRRDYSAETSRRNALARERGFRSYAEQRRHRRTPTSPGQWAELPSRARDRRADALAVLRRARHDRISVHEAAAVEGVPLPAVTWWTADALHPQRSGRILPRPADRLLRMRLIVADGEVRLVATRGSRVAARTQAAFDAQWRYVHGQARASELARFEGLRVGGHLVETDPAVLDEIGRRGDFDDIPELYRELLS